MKESMSPQKDLVKEKNGRGDAPPELALDAVIQYINESLLIANDQLPNEVTLVEGSITLQTTYNKEVGGGFKLFVRAARRWSKESSNSVTFNYKKPEKDEIKINRQDQLATVIVDAVNQYQKSLAITGLDKNGFQIELSLSITNVTDLGLEFEIFGVGFEAGANFEKTVFHKIALSFK